LKDQICGVGSIKFLWLEQAAKTGCMCNL